MLTVKQIFTTTMSINVQNMIYLLKYMCDHKCNDATCNQPHIERQWVDEE